VGQGGEADIGDGRRAHRARPRIEQRELAEHLARPDQADQVLPAVRRRPGQLDLAVEHHVQPVARVALVEQPLAPGQRDLGHPGPERLRPLIVKGLKQRRPPQHVLGVFHGTSSPASRSYYSVSPIHHQDATCAPSGLHSDASQRCPLYADCLALDQASGGEQHRIQPDSPGFVIHFVLIPLALGYFDGHIEVHDPASRPRG
jgi:hypothetical protein